MVCIQFFFENWELNSIFVKPFIGIAGSISPKPFRLVELISNSFIATIIKSLLPENFIIKNTISNIKVYANIFTQVFTKKDNMLFIEVFSNYLKVFKMLKISFDGFSVKKEMKIEKSCLAVLFNKFNLFSKFENSFESILRRLEENAITAQTYFESGFGSITKQIKPFTFRDFNVSFEGRAGSILRSLEKNAITTQTSFENPIIEIMQI